jgi:hypothetical protein
MGKKNIVKMLKVEGSLKINTKDGIIINPTLWECPPPIKPYPL